MTRRTALLPLVACGALLASCAADPCEGNADVYASPEGLTLTREEHPVGWGNPDCYACHALATIHTADCSEEGPTPEELAGFVDPDDPASCTMCHGDNGGTR